MLEFVIVSSEAAELLGIGERAVRKQCELGKLIARKTKQGWLIDKRCITK